MNTIPTARLFATHSARLAGELQAEHERGQHETAGYMHLGCGLCVHRRLRLKIAMGVVAHVERQREQKP